MPRECAKGIHGPFIALIKARFKFSPEDRFTDRGIGSGRQERWSRAPKATGEARMARYDVLDASIAGLGAAPLTADTLFELGMMHSSGRSVPPDLVTAHKWFNLAAARGHGEAARLRREVAAEMTDEEIGRAQRAAREWLKAHSRRPARPDRAWRSSPGRLDAAPCQFGRRRAYLPAWRGGRVAEGGGLLNRYTGYTVSWVRIPSSPPLFRSRLSHYVRPLRGGVSSRAVAQSRSWLRVRIIDRTLRQSNRFAGGRMGRLAMGAVDLHAAILKCVASRTPPPARIQLVARSFEPCGA